MVDTSSLRNAITSFEVVADIIDDVQTDGTIITDLASVTPASGDSILISDVSDSGSSKEALISDLADVIATYKNLLSNTYTPTLTNTTNIDASTAFSCQYARIEDFVVVSGFVNIDPTSTGTTILEISLPVASNLTASSELCGQSATTTTTSPVFGSLYGNFTNDRAYLRFVATSSVNTQHCFTFSYRVL